MTEGFFQFCAREFDGKHFISVFVTDRYVNIKLSV